MTDTKRGTFPSMMQDPFADELTQPFWDAAAEGRLTAPQCTVCGTFVLPPQPFCFECQSQAFAWVDLPGTGTVYTYTVVRHPTHFAFTDRIPYAIALVELAEGPWLITGITGCPPDEVRAGMPVRAVFRAVADGVTLPYFEPAP